MSALLPCLWEGDPECHPLTFANGTVALLPEKAEAPLLVTTKLVGEIQEKRTLNSGSIPRNRNVLRVNLIISLSQVLTHLFVSLALAYNLLITSQALKSAELYIIGFNNTPDTAISPNLMTLGLLFSRKSVQLDSECDNPAC